MSSECHLSYNPQNALLAAEEFEKDHGLSFLQFVRMFIQGKSADTANFDMLNRDWDYTICEMSRFYLKVMIYKKYNTLNAGSSASTLN